MSSESNRGRETSSVSKTTQDGMKRNQSFNKVRCFTFWCAVSSLLRLLASHSVVKNLLLDGQITFDQSTSRSSSEQNHHRGRLYHRITFTNVGWFHPDPKIANRTQRTIGAKQLMDAVLAHERFHADAWTKKEPSSYPDPNSNSSVSSSPTGPVLTFLDYDACALYHYPLFGGGNGKVNADTEHGRPTGRAPQNEICRKVDDALQQNSQALQHKDSRLVVLSCDENGRDGMQTLVQDRWRCMHRSRNMTLYSKLVVGHMSAITDVVHNSNDFGLPPWPVKKVHMSKQRLENLEDCAVRPIEVAFKGRDRLHFPEFKEYFDTLKDDEKYRIHFGVQHYIESPLQTSDGNKQVAPIHKHNQTSDPYYAWIMNSTFCAAPRGDNIYSVRFSEVMSAGCIPIVYSDGWVLPYNRHIVEDWNSLLVIIPQREVNRTKEVIESISQEKRCQMQKNVFEFYNKHVKDSRGRLDTILEMMDARLNHGVVNVSHAPHTP